MFFHDFLTSNAGFYQDPWRSTQFCASPRRGDPYFFEIAQNRSYLNPAQNFPRRNPPRETRQICDCQDCRYRKYLQMERQRENTRQFGGNVRQNRPERTTDTRKKLKTQTKYKNSVKPEEKKVYSKPSEIPIIGLKKSKNDQRPKNQQHTKITLTDKPVGNRDILENDQILVELEFPETSFENELEADEEIIIQPDS